VKCYVKGCTHVFSFPSAVVERGRLYWNARVDKSSKSKTSRCTVVPELCLETGVMRLDFPRAFWHDKLSWNTESFKENNIIEHLGGEDFCAGFGVDNWKRL